MTALPIRLEPSADIFPTASAAAFAWRGQCIDRFARSERRIGELLLLYARGGGTEQDARFMPHLVGQKYERLLALQDQPGPLQDKHLKMRLEGMMPFHDLRAMLCHGEMTVGLLANGDWMIGLEILCCEKGEAVSRSLALTRVQAETLAAHLAKASNALGSAIGQVRRRLTADGPIIPFRPTTMKL